MTLQESLTALHPVALLSPRLWQREGTQIQSWCHSQRGRTLPRVHETLLALLMHYPCASPGGDFPKESVNGRAARAGTNHCCLFFFFFFLAHKIPVALHNSMLHGAFGGADRWRCTLPLIFFNPLRPQILMKTSQMMHEAQFYRRLCSFKGHRCPGTTLVTSRKQPQKQPGSTETSWYFCPALLWSTTPADYTAGILRKKKKKIDGLRFVLNGELRLRKAVLPRERQEEKGMENLREIPDFYPLQRRILDRA